MQSQFITIAEAASLRGPVAPLQPAPSFLVHWRKQRVRRFLSIDLDTAIRIYTQFRARMEASLHGLLDNALPLDSLRQSYMQHVRQTVKPSVIDRYTVLLNNILVGINVPKVENITIDRVLKFREARLAPGKISPATVNKEVAALSRMLNFGVRHQLIGSNPIKDLKHLRHDKPNERRPLEGKEPQRLLEASREPWRSIWYAYLTTGMRAMELCQLRIPDLDFTNREIIVRAGYNKSGRERRIPMDDRLYDTLRRLVKESKTRQPGGYHSDPETDRRVKERFTRDHVFVTTQNTPLRHRNLYRAFLASCKKAEIETKTYGADKRVVEHVDLHSLRMTFATDLIENGADPKTVQELMGHATLEMTMRLYTADDRASGKRLPGCRTGPAPRYQSM